MTSRMARRHMDGYSGWSLSADPGASHEKPFLAMTSAWCPSPLPQRFGAPPPMFATARSSLSSRCAVLCLSSGDRSSPLEMTGARPRSACGAPLSGTEPRYLHRDSSSSRSLRSLATAGTSTSAGSSSSSRCLPVLSAPSTPAAFCWPRPSKSPTMLISRSCGRSCAETALRTLARVSLLRSSTRGSETRPSVEYIIRMRRSRVLCSRDFCTA
mmetsp:Transcript_103845/g.293681  ORF Transcript_103845/g.293681 Transcript_103845/m.293681 type:complete len:213 (+) Transcript_103845:571-1209(+)